MEEAFGDLLKTDIFTEKENGEDIGHVSYKLYINPGPEIEKFIRPFMEKCNESRMPAVVKIMRPENVVFKGRSDVINLYTNTPENVIKMYNILLQVVQENEIELRRKTKEFSISLDENDTIGLGYDGMDLNKWNFHSWSMNMEEIITNQIKLYFQENGDLTGEQITKIKEKYPEKYEVFCEELYEKLNKQCSDISKKILGLHDIITMKPSRSTGKITDDIDYSSLKVSNIQINGLSGNIKYSRGQKGYIITYEDGTKVRYNPKVVFDSIGRGEITYVEEKNKESADDTTTDKIEQPESIKEMQLPEGAKWKLSSRGKYILQIDGKDGSKLSYSAEVANKKFGVKVPSQQGVTGQLPEGAKWKLNSRGKYILQIDGKDGSKLSYSAEIASKKFGINIPDHKKKEITLQEGREESISMVTYTRNALTNGARTTTVKDFDQQSKEDISKTNPVIEGVTKDD